MTVDRPLRIGVTGHINLAAGTATLVREALAGYLTTVPVTDIVGVTCLAAGADQLFAKTVRDAGGTYEAVLPGPDYRAVLPDDERPEFDELLAGARAVAYAAESSGAEAYVAANQLLLDSIDVLVAVWDGLPCADPASTAAVVSAARRRGLDPIVIWPAGAARSPDAPAGCGPPGTAGPEQTAGLERRK
jgi:hypothetical protein